MSERKNDLPPGVHVQQTLNIRSSAKDVERLKKKVAADHQKRKSQKNTKKKKRSKDKNATKNSDADPQATFNEVSAS